MCCLSCVVGIDKMQVVKITHTEDKSICLYKAESITYTPKTSFTFYDSCSKYYMDEIVMTKGEKHETLSKIIIFTALCMITMFIVL